MAGGKRYDIITFDCYGTLVDWEEGIGSAFVREAAAMGVEVDRGEALAVHVELEPQIQQGTYRSYREILDEVARRGAARLGFELKDERAGFLSDSLVRWRPFADSVPALRRLSEAGYRLGILSNVDRDLFDATRVSLEVPFDLVITAEDVRSYKPSPAHFQAARSRLGDAKWLHAAQSRFHDVRPAHRLGIPVVWINRNEEHAHEAEPDHQLPDLAALADELT